MLTVPRHLKMLLPNAAILKNKINNPKKTKLKKISNKVIIY